nr:uncharacterized protein LOC109771187 [Aegilops tauschii subsp. strangulata]
MGGGHDPAQQGAGGHGTGQGRPRPQRPKTGRRRRGVAAGSALRSWGKAGNERTAANGARRASAAAVGTRSGTARTDQRRMTAGVGGVAGRQWARGRESRRARAEKGTVPTGAGR